MKLQNKILLAAAAIMTAACINVASAQYRAVGADGVAASPKVRLQIDDRNRSQAPVAPTAQSHSCCPSVNVSQGCKTGCCAK